MQVNAHFTFDLNVQSSSTSGTCDPNPFSPECETYLLFCLRGMRSDRSRNIGNCPLGNHGRINENSLPSMPSISSDNPWPVSLLWGVHVACDWNSIIPFPDSNPSGQCLATIDTVLLLYTQFPICCVRGLFCFEGLTDCSCCLVGLFMYLIIHQARTTTHFGSRLSTQCIDPKTFSIRTLGVMRIHIQTIFLL